MNTAAITLEIVPMKLLRKFCVAQRYGIRYVSTRSKEDLIAAMREVAPGAENEIPAWLEANVPGYTVEALPGGGRRLTEDYGNGVKRVYSEENGHFGVRFIKDGDEIPRLEPELEPEPEDEPEYVAEITLLGTVDELGSGKMRSNLIINVEEYELTQGDVTFALPPEIVKKLRIDDHLVVKIFVGRDKG